MSGLPLKDLSTNLIQKFKKNLKNKVFIIGVGGVDSGKSAFEKITAGASAVQLYTGMIYKGPIFTPKNPFGLSLEILFITSSEP